MKRSLLLLSCAILLSRLIFAQTELIQNGDFTLPDDQLKHQYITDTIPFWLSDDTTKNDNGREYADELGDGVLNPECYMRNTAGSVYQLVGKVPSAASTYDINFSASIAWDASAGDEVTLTFKLSAYSGSDPKTRKLIDSTDFILTDPQKTWNPYEGSISIPGGSAFAGQNLVVEFDVTQSVVNPTDNNIWVNIDDISVLQSIGTSVILNKTANLKIYPVPAHSEITVSSGQMIEEYSLLDISGKEILRSSVGGTNAKLNIERYSNGLYFVKVRLNDGSCVMKKVIKE